VRLTTIFSTYVGEISKRVESKGKYALTWAGDERDRAKKATYSLWGEGIRRERKGVENTTPGSLD